MIDTIFKRGVYLIRFGSYIPTEYFLVPEKHLVYISVPKVACTSIKSALYQKEHEIFSNNVAHISIHKTTKNYVSYKLRGEAHDFFKFAFVRNPFDRIVSCYEDKIKREQRHAGRHFFATKYNNILINTLFGERFSKDMSFGDFVRLVSRIPDRFSDAHFKSQSSFLYDTNGDFVPDFVGKFENIEDDWGNIAARFSLPFLKKKNKTTRNNWMNYYDSIEIVRLVFKRYKNDIDILGYDEQYKSLCGKVTKKCSA